MKRFLTMFAAVVSTFLINAPGIHAQPESAKTIKGGVLNGKAVSLPFPEYPEEARKMNLSGTVVVEIEVDENGNVMSASAAHDAGTIYRPDQTAVPPAHPILREAAEKAAMKAKFSPTMLSGAPVKVTGRIVYNIVSGGGAPVHFNNSASGTIGGVGVISGGQSGYQAAAARPGSSAMPKQISGGVLNGKATSLPKPAYPPAARAVNAEGAVSVQVLIDEEGKIASANAVSGHPLLRAAATQAALAATFSPTQLAGQPVKVSGIITYNFVGSMTPGMLGYEIGYAERAGMFSKNSFAQSLAARLPESLADEKVLLESLDYEPLEKPSAETKTVVQSVATVQPRDTNKFTVRGDVNFAPIGGTYAQRKLTTESIESLRRMQSAIDSKLGGEEIRQWHFRLGRSLGAFVAEIEDENKTRINVAELENLSATAPSTISQMADSNLKALIDYARNTEMNAETRKASIDAANSLRNLRISSW